jgi:hypothetical protein
LVSLAVRKIAGARTQAAIPVNFRVATFVVSPPGAPFQLATQPLPMSASSQRVV